MLFGLFAFLGQMQGQEVIVHCDEGARAAAAKKHPAAHTQVAPAVAIRETYPRAQPVVNENVFKGQPVKDLSPRATAKPQLAKALPVTLLATKPQPAIAQTSKPVTPGLPQARNMRLTKVDPPAPEPSRQLPLRTEEAGTRIMNAPMETAFIKIADGFDFPIGKPDAQGYYKARGFRSKGHLGEDWDGIRGGDTDLGDPIYSIGDGIVVFARDCHMGWGNVIIVRHTYREGGQVENIDALYGHLNNMAVHRGQSVARGQKIATMGTAHGLYDAHLHLEIRKNIEIGMSRAAFAKDFSNYYDPTQFINAHRHLQAGGGTYRVAMNTFVRDAHINFDAARNYSHARSGGGTRESAAALKKAIARKN
ncbi:MAG: nlpD [Spartobacteria bacterium]|nr:nlpD [Spartobacteria bacterium]